MAKKRRSSRFRDNSQVIDIEEARAKRQEKRSKQRKTDAGNQSTERPVRTGRPARSGSINIKQKKLKRRLIYAGIIIIILMVIGSAVYKIVALKQEQRDLELEQQVLKNEKIELEDELTHLHDPAYIEEQARAKLRMIMPGEKIYVFPKIEEPETTEDNEN